MTAQVGDKFVFNGKLYRLLDADNAFSFHPTEFGIVPQYTCTACYRGYWCAYRVTDDGIFLDELYVNSRSGEYPDIGGVEVSHDEREIEMLYMGHHVYKGLEMRVPFTGRLLLGDRFMDEEFLYMGYTEPWKYEHLVELRLDDGRMTECIDQSDMAAMMRKKRDEIDDKIREAFEKEGKIIHYNPKIDFGVDVWWIN